MGDRNLSNISSPEYRTTIKEIEERMQAMIMSVREADKVLHDINCTMSNMIGLSDLGFNKEEMIMRSRLRYNDDLLPEGRFVDRK